MKDFLLPCCLGMILSSMSKSLPVIRLPPIMCSNMVLQQNTQATRWEWVNPGELNS